LGVWHDEDGDPLLLVSKGSSAERHEALSRDRPTAGISHISF
jgi:hypothetical protein